MQRKIGTELKLGKTVSPVDSIGSFSAIDRTVSNFLNASKKVQKIKKPIKAGEYDTDIAKYIPEMLELAYQGMPKHIDIKEQPTHISHKDIENLEFQILLTNNYYTNPNSIYICSLMKIEKATDEIDDIDNELIIVNSFFAHLIKEISRTKYENDKQLIPTFSPYEIYQHSDSMLKNLPEKLLKKKTKTMLYSNKPVYQNRTTIERRTFNSTASADIADLNNEQRIKDFQDMLKSKHVYRVPLCYFCDTGKIIFPIKIDFKTKCHLETHMVLFESKKKVNPIGAPDAKLFLQKLLFSSTSNFY